MKIPTTPGKIIKDIWDFFLFAALVAALVVCFAFGAIYIMVRLVSNG